MLGLLARKEGMTQVFDSDGNVVPVTVLKAGPCVVTAVRTEERCGYNAVQVGFMEVKPSRVSKPQLADFRKKGVCPFRYLREFRTEKAAQLSVGRTLDAALFKEGDLIKVTALTKGKGFQGVVKRHGKHGGCASHGSRFHRAPGSIGQCTSPSRVFKNMKLPGHQGVEKVTIRNVKVVYVDAGDCVVLVKGAVPGPRGGVVRLESLDEHFDERVVEMLSAAVPDDSASQPSSAGSSMQDQEVAEDSKSSDEVKRD